MTDNQKPNLEELKLLWEEFKYRHDLVWRILVAGTILSATLGVIPYTHKQELHAIGYFALALPIGSVCAVLATGLALYREIKLLNVIKRKYLDKWDRYFAENRSSENVFQKVLPGLMVFGVFVAILNAVCIVIFLGK